MQDSRQHVPNPLRPYYVPPSIGTDSLPNATPNASKPSSQGTGFTFPDIDYSDYIPEASPSLTGTVKSYIDQAFWKYTTVVLGQPFEVAKLILQARVAQDEKEDDKLRRRQSYQNKDQGDTNGFGDYDDQHSSDDEPNYFTSSAPHEHSSGRSPVRGRRGRPPREYTSPRAPERHQHPDGRIHLKNPHSLLETLSALSSSGGALAMWRATNSTFVYNILMRTLETFLKGFLAAVFGVAENDILSGAAGGAVPDISILTSTSPAATILISTAAATLSSLVLAPIDAARTRLVLTPSNQGPRTLLGTLQTLPTPYLIPAHLFPITFLTSTIPTLISTSTPVVLKSYLGLDPAMNPASWSIATFVGSAMDLSIKFPLETVLRRAQIATWTSPAFSPPTTASKHKAITTIVPVPQSYRGILPTIWSITRDEGYSESQKDKTAALMGKAPRRRRKGQGIEGLYRGWRVGFWGLIGVWGTSFVGGLQSGTEAASAQAGPHGGKF
jgi:mitochondrial fusion and transport protein UGO1